ncbi:MAG TPA: hypothetical protein VN376_07620, partial [Longilinea sp.]|nr:hypothetical protein [Longilinea sp.]
IWLSLVAAACTGAQNSDDSTAVTASLATIEPISPDNSGSSSESGVKPSPETGDTAQGGDQTATDQPQGGNPPAEAGTNDTSGQSSGADGNCPIYYTETWDGSTTQCWLFEDTFVVSSPDQDEIHMNLTDTGALRMRIEINETYLYLPYSQGYSGVSITAEVTSNQVNSHEASLFCGFNENGFYEVRFNTAGTFAVYQFDTARYLQGGNPYIDLIQGNSTLLRTGNGRTNTVELICDQSTITVNINGEQEFSQNIPGSVMDGGVGIGAISHENYPVELDFDNIVIAQP